jgi:hypothetical protein
LYNFAKKCLESASKHSCRSIAFPALGTGYLKFPPDLAASKVIQAIKDFQSKQPQTTLSEVKIVIFGGTNDWAKIEQVFIIFASFYIFVIWSFSSLHDHFVCHFFPALVLFEESNCID